MPVMLKYGFSLGILLSPCRRFLSDFNTYYFQFIFNSVQYILKAIVSLEDKRVHTGGHAGPTSDFERLYLDFLLFANPAHHDIEIYCLTAW